MDRKFGHTLRIIISSIALFESSTPIAANTYTWVGTTSELTTGSNWTPAGPPVANDTAIFPAVANFAPTLVQDATLNAGLFTFSSGGATPYAISLDEYSRLTFKGTSPSLLGVQNLSTLRQTFTQTAYSVIDFEDTASADIGNTGLVTYNVNGIISFSTAASAGSAVFTTLAGFYSLIDVSESSTAANATITINEGASIVFIDSSTAANATITINATRGSAFYESATAANALITLVDGGTLAFQDSATADASSITASASSTLAFGDSSTAATATLAATASSLITFANNSTASSSGITLTDKSNIYFKNSSTAATSTIALDDKSDVKFQDYATADSATITANDQSRLYFYTLTTADDATISLSGSSQMSFTDSSNAGNANITANDSDIYFSSFSSAQNSSIHLNGASTLNFSLPITPFPTTLAASNSTIVAYDTSSINFSDYSQAYTASITLNDNAKLFFYDASGAASANIDLAGEHTKLVFAQNIAPQTGADSYVFKGVLSGNGILRKKGSAKVSITAQASDFTGPTYVEAGNLALNTHIGGNVTAFAQGTLSGAGSVAGNLKVTNKAKVAPGSSTQIGTLTCDGNYQQTDSAIYQVGVTNLGANSLITIAADATLQDQAAVYVTPLVGANLQLPANENYTNVILHSDGSLTGKYVGVTSSNPLVAYSLSYDDHDVFLSSTNTLAILADTYNQKNVATALQSLTQPTASEYALLSTLASLPPNEGQSSLNQMSGQQYGNVLAQSEIVNQQFMLRLYNPLRTQITELQSFTDPCDRSVDFWIDEGYQRSFINGTNNADGYRTNGYEFTIGAQANLNATCVIGGAFCYENDHVHYNAGGGTGNGSSYLGGLYGLYRPNYFYVLSDLVFGYSEQKVRRHVHVGDLSYRMDGRPEIYQGNLYVEGGFDYNWRCLLIQPFLGLQGGYAYRSQVHEHSRSGFSDLLNLSIADRNVGIGQSRLGVHLTTKYSSCLTIALDLAWRSRFGSLGNHISAYFDELDAGFNARGVGLNRNSFEGIIDFYATIGDGWELYTEGSGQWSTNIASYSLLGGLTYNW